MTGRQRLVERVEKRLADVPLAREDADSHTVFRLAPAEGADYSFSVWLYEDGESQLCASLVPLVDEQYFWCAHFEGPDWPTPEARDDDFLESLSAALAHPTRITQVRGLLFQSFECKFKDKTRRSLGGTSAFRFANIKFPPMVSKRHRYFSPALE